MKRFFSWTSIKSTPNLVDHVFLDFKRQKLPRESTRKVKFKQLGGYPVDKSIHPDALLHEQ